MSGFRLLDELFQFETGDVVVEQGGITHFFDRTVIVVVVAEFVAGADHFHAKIFVSADHVTRTQTADVEHDLLAFRRGLNLATMASIIGW
jgi:hypothetical protein